MSGLTGVRWLDDDKLATHAHVSQPLQSLAHRGPDGLFSRVAGPCALGFAHFDTTPEATLERQPVVRGGVTVTFDGRLDNASEVISALSLTHPPSTDAAIVAAAWERWGVDSLPRLVGDFALAVWEAPTRTLWLARDVFGLRPLFYRIYKRGCWWASELQTLARLGDATPYEGVIGDYLADAIRSETETLVSGVMRLPRASVMRVTSHAPPRTHRYWVPRRDAPANRCSDADALEQFRSLFSVAVRARLRSDQRVGISLSGGVDSALVAAEAAALANRRDGAAVEAFTLTWPGPSDESPYAQAVSNHLKLTYTLCPAGEIGWNPIVADAHRSLDLPAPPNSVAAATMSAALRAKGIRVCLNGIGGDEWFTGNRFAFADEMRALDASSIWSRVSRRRSRSSLSRDALLALWVQIPEPGKRHLRRFLPSPDAPRWIDRAFVSRIDLTDRLRTPLEVPRLASYEQQVAFGWATHPDKIFTFEFAERLSAAAGCEERLPFMDRRLVEWALTLPAEQRSRSSLNKVVLRNAARLVLPAEIASRRFLSDCSDETIRGLRVIGGHAGVRAIAERRHDWVNPAEISDLWRALESADQKGPPPGYASWMLWLLVATHVAVDAIENCHDRWVDDGWVGSVADATIRRHAARVIQETVA
jgi:asparagine synthase (glutamine-hydrolysing)